MHISDSRSPRSPGGRPHAYIRQLEPQVSWRAASCIYPTAGGPGLLAGGLVHISDRWRPRSPGGPPQAYIQSLSVAATGRKRPLSYPICTRPAQLLVSLSVPPHIPSSSATGTHQCTAPHTHQLDPPASVSVPLQGGDRSKKSNFCFCFLVSCSCLFLLFLMACQQRGAVSC